MKAILSSVFCCCLGVQCSAGNVTIDNSFGRKPQSLTGPGYDIPASLGKTVGKNLFHSFGQFDLSQGDVATFSGPDTIKNVLSRVTGGAPSSIDGTIQSTIAGANFYFINPHGVVFGPHAKMDVSGSLVVTSADYVKLADGARFRAGTPSDAADALLTTAAPEAFGFLGSTPGAIVFQGPGGIDPAPVLAQVPDGQSIAVIGGDIRLVDAQFYASGGRVALVSTASAGELRFDASDAAAAIDTSAFVQLGNIELLDHAFMYLSGERGGRFTADAENVSAETSFIFADNYGAADGLGIEINARDSITLANLTIISAFVFGSGNGGNINLNARSIVLNGYTDQGGNSVNIFTETGGDGKGGDVVIRADSFEMNGGNAIGVSASGPGDGGSIQITASSVRLNGQAFGAELAAFTAGGRSGGITITSDSLEIQSGAQIRTDTLAGSFDGGPIQITTSLLRLDGTGQGLLPTTIASTTSQDSVAAGGDITIRPNAGSKLTMEVWNGASVNTSSSTSGDGGNIHVEAADVRLQNGVSIQSSASGSGDAGNVAIGATGSVSLQQNSSLSVSSLQSDGGSITVTAGNEIRVKDSSVTAQAAVNGGDITLKADKLVYFLNSTLTAEAISGNGGNINIDPPLVVFNNSSINASSADAAGGNISIIASGFLASGTPITASGAQAGTISIQTPDQDITDELASLEEEPIDAETLLQPHCGVRLKNISTFSVLSRGAPIAPNQLLPSINVE